MGETARLAAALAEAEVETLYAFKIRVGTRRRQPSGRSRSNAPIESKGTARKPREAMSENHARSLTPFRFARDCLGASATVGRCPAPRRQASSRASFPASTSCVECNFSP